MTFQNEYLDKFKHNQYHTYLKELRLYAGISRKELSNLSGISVYTIRRYESNWHSSTQPPEYYEMLLRFLCGDLSYFGHYWTNCRIHPHDHKMINPYTPHARMSPSDMHVQYSRIYNESQRELNELRKEIEAIKAHNLALKADNELLHVQLERLKHENERLHHHKNSVKTGKVVPIFGKKA
ncbi:hypothetical protein P8629_07060 [Hydrogenovibrio sp. 3SP14C1]|uniref:helix-turn-helix domain-containing protein n=1 Tax=Hydrogenovibrio sp. 3SP14C1 TaxID=3038774 RepID=UPI002417D9CA|nr:hypothetical protein [Hydrogenovibrio sp. 3SP14C1]MDG4812765.1 hypothetical protein [Hydrogenovibrio sp. 3SP14C1]